MKDLEHYEVHATDGRVGRVTDFLFEDAYWTVRYLVLEPSDDPSGRKVLIERLAFGDVDYSANRFRVALSRKDVDCAPAAEGYELASRQSEGEYRASPGQAAEPESDTHTRSAKEITGYSIEGTDGPMGHVQDLVVDDGTWAIQYMVVATANWWPGKSVLLSPRWATLVRWGKRRIDVEMTREAIKTSPKWSVTHPVDAEYAEALARHYQGIPGWRGRDRSLDPVLARGSSKDEATTESEQMKRADARVAAHEERQIRAADDAVIQDAREGRLP